MEEIHHRPHREVAMSLGADETRGQVLCGCKVPSWLWLQMGMVERGLVGRKPDGAAAGNAAA